jgi:SAM-dependent methyltransferase
MHEIASILSSSSKAKLIEKIPTKKIINEYKQYLKIDVKRFFENIPHISLYECKESGVRFFYPFNIEGDSRFYEDLSRNAWYYMEWKWEHEETKKLLKPHFNVLEIGCGKGSFIKAIEPLLINKPIGLELNQESVSSGKQNNIDIRPEFIQTHANSHANHYDVVCSFQVLEHISEINSFLKASIDCLKSGGQLVIAVPNNNSFIKEDPFPLLNMPPHHMGRWTVDSIARLTDFFPLKVVSIQAEPFQEHHLEYYKRIKLTNILKSTFLSAVFFKLKLDKLFFSDKDLLNQNKEINGHSLIAIFEKI